MTTCGWRVRRGEVALLHVGGEDGRLVGEQEEAADDELFLRGQRQPEGVGGLAGVQVRADLLQQVRLQQGVLVAAFDVARDLLQPLLDGLQVGQHQLGGDDLDVAHRVNVSGDVDDVRVLEAAHDVDERIHLADVAEELVAEALAVGRALDQAGDVHELKGRRD